MAWQVYFFNSWKQKYFGRNSVNLFQNQANIFWMVKLTSQTVFFYFIKKSIDLNQCFLIVIFYPFTLQANNICTNGIEASVNVLVASIYLFDVVNNTRPPSRHSSNE